MFNALFAAALRLAIPLLGPHGCLLLLLLLLLLQQQQRET